MVHQDAILLVEDDANDVVLIQRAFQRARIVNPVHVAEDGEAAIAYLSGQEPFADRDRHPLPVLMLLDLKLPRKSGLEVLAWVRQQPGLKRLPVLVLTSSAQGPDINQAYDTGANSYLVKPIRADDLVALARGVHLYWTGLNARPDLGNVDAK
jgi:CheY-like chemotaxis protein